MTMDPMGNTRSTILFGSGFASKFAADFCEANNVYWPEKEKQVCRLDVGGRCVFSKNPTDVGWKIWQSRMRLGDVEKDHDMIEKLTKTYKKHCNRYTYIIFIYTHMHDYMFGLHSFQMAVE